MLFVISVIVSVISTVSGLEPRFNVVTKNVTVISGQTAVLPCSVDFLGIYKVVWLDHRGKLLTFEDRRIIADERISLERPYVKEWNLHIRNVRPSDDGKYMCQVNTDPVQVRPVHLHVHEPAKIINHLSTPSTVMVREGETVELVCNVTGVPHPMVTWYRIPTGLMQDSDRKAEADRRKKQIGVAGEVLVIHNVTRYCDDVYECVAYNNVPPAAHRSIRVYVEFPPEVRLPNRKIGQSLGKTTILECVVTAYPHAITVWRRHGEDIERNAKYNIEVYDEDENTLTLALRIQSLSRDDYGKYECVSENLLGKDSETMMLYEYPLERTTMSTTTTTRKTNKPGHGQNAHSKTKGRHNGGNSHQSGKLPGSERKQGGAERGEDGWWKKPNSEAQGYQDNNNGYQSGHGKIQDPGYSIGSGGNGDPRNGQVIVDPSSSRGTTVSPTSATLHVLCVSAIVALTLFR
ncbi:limbic system-associated membrane protein-like [Littorina saxatilis]|uniref:limbic system-associated membrane protein-like n=1 Tax=Littorina saxatilis TaxID=31220 RepID=UPI0038B442CB